MENENETTGQSQHETPSAAKRKVKRKYHRKTRAHPGVIETVAPKYAERQGHPMVTGHRYTVDLQARHADWLEAVAKSEGRSAENMLERLVRLGYAADPYKGKGPQAEASGSFSGKASDLKET